MAMAVVLDAGLSQLIVTPAGGAPEVYTLSNDCFVEKIAGNKFTTTPVVPGAFPGYTTGGSTKTPDFRVIVREVNIAPLIIHMGTVTNQPLWENTEPGCDQCIADIQAIIP